MSIVEFILARTTELEQSARATIDQTSTGSPAGELLVTLKDQLLIHLAGERLAIEDHLEDTDACADGGSTAWPCDTLKHLALPYAEHRDYRPEWRP